MKNYPALIAIFLFILPTYLHSQTCRDVSVEVSATVQTSPPVINLKWVANTSATQHYVYRKLKTGNSWGNPVATLSGTDTVFSDSSVSIGVSYEYKILRICPTFTGYGYINSGINIPPIEARGTLILLIDSTFIDSLASELGRLKNDLEGDGWKVIRHDVSRTMAVTGIKSIIVNDYNNDPLNTRSVFIFGHVPVPYSGDLNPDGHTDHKGAWPADVYYGDMDGNWTDASINDVSASDPRNDNIPGDGKFDQSALPSDVELQLGRVDFANMPAFASSEGQLLKNYLDKDHDYRKKNFVAVHRAVVDDNFGYFSGEAFASSGWKNFAPLTGPANVSANDYFSSMTGNSYLWSYGCGGGTYTSAGGIGSTANFATSSLQGVFTMLFGSYFGDWDSQNNFLRAALAQGKILTNVWSGRPHWQFHHMALGENIGYDVRLSQNNSSLYFASYGGRFIDNALMGDPSLRNDVVAPVSNVVATVAGTNCYISWTASTDTVLGYFIYRKNDSITNYVRVNQNVITGTSFTDSCLLYPGTYTYMVRALVLQTSPSGTYYNLSEGISDTALNNNYLAVHAAASYTTVYNVVTFTNASDNATTFQWDFGDGAFSNLQDPVHTYLDGNYTVRLIAGNGCDADTILLTISILTGIDEVSNPGLLVVSPNPSTGKFLISFDKRLKTATDLQIFTLPGSLLLHVSQIINGSYEVDLSDQPAGIYYLQIREGNKLLRKKLVLVK